ncbi:MAG: hypothetical protein ACOCW6_07250, partial [Spirochaetota bacterium]
MRQVTSPAFGAIAAFALLLLPFAGWADDFEWIGGSGTLAWDNGANWNRTAGGGAHTYPGELGAGDTATFNGGDTVTVSGIPAATIDTTTINAGDSVTLAADL